MIYVNAVWVELQQFWADTSDTLRGAFLGALITLVVFRLTRRHQWKLERVRRDQDRHEGVYRDVLTLIDPVSRWLEDSRNKHGDVSSPPELDDKLRIKVNIAMDLDYSLTKTVWNTSPWWWGEWNAAYENVVGLGPGDDVQMSRALVRLDEAEAGLRRAFSRENDRLYSRTGILNIWLDYKRMSSHGVTFRGEPTLFEWLVKRVRTFRQKLTDEAELRGLVRESRKLSRLTTDLREVGTV